MARKQQPAGALDAPAQPQPDVQPTPPTDAPASEPPADAPEPTAAQPGEVSVANEILTVIADLTRDAFNRGVEVGRMKSQYEQATPLPDDCGSARIDLISAALAQAQKTLENPPKDKTARVPTKDRETGRVTGEYTYDYADLATVLDEVRPKLAACGIAIHQYASTPTDRTLRLRTVLSHESGQWFSSSLTVALADAKPQTLGSAITYLRRYQLQSMTGVAAEVDDDAMASQSITGTTESRENQARQQARPEPRRSRARQDAPAEPAEPSPAAPPDDEPVGTKSNGKITDKQVRELNDTVAKHAEKIGVDKAVVRDRVRTYLRTIGVEKSADLPAGRFDEVMKFVGLVQAEREPGEEG